MRLLKLPPGTEPFKPGSNLPKTPRLPKPGETAQPTAEDELILSGTAPLRDMSDLRLKTALNQLAYYERNAAR